MNNGLGASACGPSAGRQQLLIQDINVIYDTYHVYTTTTHYKDELQARLLAFQYNTNFVTSCLYDRINVDTYLY